MSRVNNNEHKKPDTGNQGPEITLKVKSQDGIEVSIRIIRNTPLKKLLNTYCFRRFVRPNCVTFLFAGRLFGREQTPDELEMEEGDVIHAFFHQTEKQRVCFDEQKAKDIAREKLVETFLRNKVWMILWRIISKLIAENSSLKKKVTRITTKLIKDEDKDDLFLKIGRLVRESFAKNSAPCEELKKELKRLREELKEDLKEEVTKMLKDLEEDDDDDDDDEEEDDEDFIDTGRFVLELIEWVKKNQDFLRSTLSRL